MESKIIWNTGEPTSIGFYLTVRKSRKTGETHVMTNYYAKDELSKHGKIPSSFKQGWQDQCADGCDIVAWYKVDEIKVI